VLVIGPRAWLADLMIWSDEITTRAAAIHARIERTLRAAGVPGELEWTGASSVPGTLTKGDVDLHLRVPAELFGATVEQLKGLLPVAVPSAWAPTLAVFDVPEQELPTGLAVTPAGSEHDRRFTLAWQRIAAEPELHRRYNELKREPAHEERKSDFFSELTGT
jgi:GrpB-like predicted nucleotidyltransferase (UPF0157 family)